MPELPEVEAYRRLAQAALHRTVSGVEAPDPWYLKGGLDAEALAKALVGNRLGSVRRVGKRLRMSVERADGFPGAVLGLRFGMSGSLLVDGHSPLEEELLYTSGRPEPGWVRLTVAFEDGGSLSVRDPRRLGGVELDPSDEALGPDAEEVSLVELGRALSGRAPLKARLLDQSRLAGVGNLLGDEVLWRAGLDPRRPAGSLSFAELRQLHLHLRSATSQLIARGGSHKGDLWPQRRPGGRCPEDGEELACAKVGGRTTWWCPRHQR
jgi:formamidopyrimidine-DNA glycosylase